MAGSDCHALSPEFSKPVEISHARIEVEADGMVVFQGWGDLEFNTKVSRCVTIRINFIAIPRWVAESLSPSEIGWITVEHGN